MDDKEIKDYKNKIKDYKYYIPKCDNTNNYDVVNFVNPTLAIFKKDNIYNIIDVYPVLTTDYFYCTSTILMIRLRGGSIKIVHDNDELYTESEMRRFKLEKIKKL
jgi:hypothetical protein